MTLEKSQGATDMLIPDQEDLFEFFATKMRAAGMVELGYPYLPSLLPPASGGRYGIYRH